MLLTPNTAEVLLPNLGLYPCEPPVSAALKCRIWRTESLGLFHSVRKELLAYENVTQLVREADDILQHLHFLSVTQIGASQERWSFWVTASLFSEEPKVLAWHSAKLIILGSYQSVYAICEATHLQRFTVATPEGGGVDQLCLCTTSDGREILLVVTDSVIRAILPTGAVLWLAHSDEVVVITSLTGGRIVCEPRVKAGKEDRRRWLLSSNSGERIETPSE